MLAAYASGCIYLTSAPIDMDNFMHAGDPSHPVCWVAPRLISLTTCLPVDFLYSFR